jgi:hypothetical protein
MEFNYQIYHQFLLRPELSNDKPYKISLKSDGLLK